MEFLTSCLLTILGLKIRLQGNPLPSKFYTYAFSPYTKLLKGTEEIVIVDTDRSHKHIRCHSLKSGDKLTEIILSLRLKDVVALVLINSNDTYTLAPEFTEGMEEAIASFPILILTKSDGEHLNEFIKNHSTQNVLAQVVVIDSDTHLQHTQREANDLESTVESDVKSEVGLSTGMYTLIHLCDRWPLL